MKCSEYLDIYNASVNIDFCKANLLLRSEKKYMLPWRDRKALVLVAWLLTKAVNILGRMLERHTGEVEEKAKNNNLD